MAQISSNLFLEPHQLPSPGSGYIRASVSPLMTDDRSAIEETPRIRCRDLSVLLHGQPILKSIHLDVYRRGVLAIIGPSGSGKSTLLRCFNRMLHGLPGIQISGYVYLDGSDIYTPSMDVVELRTRIAMVFQSPNPYPKSIFENIAYGPRLHGLAALQGQEDSIVETALRQAGLWNEVKDRLNEPATQLSQGQQKRLCIARILAIQPDVILMDEPCASLDPPSTSRIEQLIHHLSESIGIVLVTHLPSQAQRLSDQTAILHRGRLVEYGATQRIFRHPCHPITKVFIGRQYL